MPARHLRRPRRVLKPYFAALLAEIDRRGGMTVAQMAAFLGRDARDLQGSLSGPRMRGEIAATSRRVGRNVVYVRGRPPATSCPAGPSQPSPAVVGVDEAQVRAVFAVIARWARPECGA